jgi:hypothetical protein
MNVNGFDRLMSYVLCLMSYVLCLMSYVLCHLLYSLLKRSKLRHTRFTKCNQAA